MTARIGLLCARRASCHGWRGPPPRLHLTSNHLHHEDRVRHATFAETLRRPLPRRRVGSSLQGARCAAGSAHRPWRSRSLRAEAFERGAASDPPAAVLVLDEADQRAADRRDADEAQDVALERADRVRAEVPAVEQRRHSHRHDDARRASAAATSRRPSRGGSPTAKPGPRDLLEESLDQRRHVAEPERKDQDQVVGPGDVALRRGERRGQGAGVPLLLASQEREVEPRDVDPAHLVACRAGTAAVAVSERVAEVIAIADPDGPG